MSWQAYVNDFMGAGKFIHLAICDLNGDVLATSPDFNVSREEAQKIIWGFENNAAIHNKDITINGVLYAPLEESSDDIYGQKCKGPSKGGFNARKTNKTILISIFQQDKGIQARECSQSCQLLANYLRHLGH